MDFHQKYIKYKTKYLELKASLQGKGFGKCITCMVNAKKITDEQPKNKKKQQEIPTVCQKFEYTSDTYDKYGTAMKQGLRSLKGTLCTKQLQD